MNGEDVVCVNLMLIATVVVPSQRLTGSLGPSLLVPYGGELSISVYSDRKDNHIARFVIVVSSYDRAFSLEVPFIAIIHLFTMKSKGIG